MCQEPWHTAQLSAMTLKFLSQVKGTKVCNRWLILTINSLSLALSHFFSRRYNGNPARAISPKEAVAPCGTGQQVAGCCATSTSEPPFLSPSVSHRLQVRGCWGCLQVGGMCFAYPQPIDFYCLKE